MSITEDELDLSWFMRDEVEKEIEEKTPSIASKIRKEQIDPESERAVEIALDFIDWTDYTSEEFEYLMRSIVTQTTLMGLKEKGLVEEVEPDRFRLTSKGKLVSKAVRNKK